MKFTPEVFRNIFSEPVSVFQGRRLPEPAFPAGYAALLTAFGLEVPLPRTLAATSPHHRTVHKDGWRILTVRHSPDPTLAGHLTFALKYEGLDLAILKRLFQATGPGPIEDIVRAAPTGAYARRIWFLYEWLLGQKLDLPDASQGNYVSALDDEQQYGVQSLKSSRHRVNDNLPGTPNFCPLVFRTPRLEEYIRKDLAARAREMIAPVPKDRLARAAAFLLLADSRSSFAIEGEHPPQNRAQRWGAIIQQAGANPIDIDELIRLQQAVIGDTRFVRIGLRNDGGFVGEHDRVTHAPIPDHISARPEDLPPLLAGMQEFEKRSAGLDPVVAAACLAFGFVYTHPFEDGNGRIHRYLIHHVLARRGFNPPGLVFSVSAVILERIQEYKAVLEDYSKRLLPVIHWTPTARGNVEVTNDTADFYRYFDATPHAEFLYSCVEQTVESELPAETEFLRRYDQFVESVKTIVDMPDGTRNLLFRFLHQNGGRLSKRAREKELARLTDEEVREIETMYAEAFRE
ncbi:MAG TPA: Fic family protein [Gammaproteobacteria bacterium]